MHDAFVGSIGSHLFGEPLQQGYMTVFNLVMFVILTICYGYQFIYVLEVLFCKREKPQKASRTHRFAVLIAARNEHATIGNLLHSLNAQDYPSNHVDVFVIADNCTDDTADIARRHGATVFERHDTTHIGKGYALDYGYQCIQKDPDRRNAYDAYLVFDADNLLDPGFITAMNRTLDDGAQISTSFRNSKNYADNWISAGYGLWFLREARFLSQARKDFNTTCAISGTGFFVSADVLASAGGWKWHLLTEDIEFSVDSAIRDVRISYTPDAILFDEQPNTFMDSWAQRIRWAKGFYQVFKVYGMDLVRGVFKTSSESRFCCYDMFVTIAPGLLLTILIGLCNIFAALWHADNMSIMQLILLLLVITAKSLANYALIMFLLGAITTLAEWNSIRATTGQKIRYLFTFPFFMLTYIPIAVAALFTKPQWKPICHSVNLSIEELMRS